MRRAWGDGQGQVGCHGLWRPSEDFEKPQRALEGFLGGEMISLGMSFGKIFWQDEGWTDGGVCKKLKVERLLKTLLQIGGESL